MLIRLNKYLADHGVASRRKCEQYIRAGFIKVNGKIVREMGIKIDPEKDHVETTQHLRLKKQGFVYYALHKPVGYVCTMTGPEKPKITELIKEIPERVFPIGRLDKLTSGLLLLTNDGRYAYEMTHPRFEKEKEYVVKTREKITLLVLKKLRETFYINGKKTQPVKIMKQAPHLMRIILKEGRNRQIRRMCRRASLHIEKLKRIKIGNIVLWDLPVGKYRELKNERTKEQLFLSF